MTRLYWCYEETYALKPLLFEIFMNFQDGAPDGCGELKNGYISNGKNVTKDFSTDSGTSGRT